MTLAHEPSTLSPGQLTEKELLLARVELLEGNLAASASRLKTLVRREPENTNVLVAAAALVAQSGQTEEAMAFTAARLLRL